MIDKNELDEINEILKSSIVEGCEYIDYNNSIHAIINDVYDIKVHEKALRTKGKCILYVYYGNHDSFEFAFDNYEITDYSATFYNKNGEFDFLIKYNI
jgi:hypothetical protein